MRELHADASPRARAKVLHADLQGCDLGGGEGLTPPGPSSRRAVGTLEIAPFVFQIDCGAARIEVGAVPLEDHLPLTPMPFDGTP